MGKRILLGGALIIVLVAGIVGYMFFKAPEEATEPIQAIPLATKPAATATTASAAQPTAEPATAEPTVADTGGAAASPTAEPAAAGASSPIVFEIVQTESQAVFTIDEVLEGAPKTVVGTTDQVAGQLAVDPANPSATQIGVIQVNARTFATDSSMRDRAIKNRILMTDANEFVTFTPTTITGLPTAGEIGQEYTFEVTGDLTIKGVTKPTTFEVVVRVPSADRLEGTAMTMIRYADFDVAIPSVPMVASVSDEVALELRFVAVSVQ